MADTKKHFLIIDNDFSYDPKQLFSRSGVDVDVTVVDNAVGSIAQLEAWKAKGVGADVISMDFEEGAAHGICARINDWLEQNPSLKPKKCFVHSAKASDAEWFVRGRGKDFHNLGIIEATHAFEYSDIIGFGTPDYEPECKISCALGEYLNREWGTRYPTTMEEFDALKKANEFNRALRSPREAWEMVQEKETDQVTALQHATLFELRDSLAPIIDTTGADGPYGHFDQSIGRPLAGHLAFSAEQAADLHKQGKKAILVMQNYSADEMALLSGIDGAILCGSGTEHLEGILKSFGISALLKGPVHIENERGAQRLVFEGNELLDLPQREFVAGDAVTLVGEARGNAFYPGLLPIREPDISGMDWLKGVLGWADESSRKNGGMAVRMNANIPANVKLAAELGADGIGLLRTEHMFFSPEGLKIMREGLLDPDTHALSELKALQKKDFKEIYATAMNAGKDFPVTIRLLDPPPYEFLGDAGVAKLTARVGGKANTRGVQLALHTPGLYRAQAEAIFEAAQETGYAQPPEIMIPLVRNAGELEAIRKEIDEAAQKTGFKKPYRFGAMLETVAAYTGEETKKIAAQTDFLSFGPKDLTMEITGVRPQDIEAAKAWMKENKHYDHDIPFQTLVRPVQEKMHEAMRAVRETKPQPIAMCGDEIGSDKNSLFFCQREGIASVSVTPETLRLMEARILTGQAALAHPGNIRQAGYSSRYEPGGISPRRIEETRGGIIERN
jgi:pyruvate,orthophosphate dikinase